MLTYHGWDREEMLQRGGVENEASPQEALSGPSTGAFTPINPSHAPAQLVQPQTTLHERGLDDDALYKEFPEISSEIPTQKERKRTAAKASKGRAVSIAQVWEYTDEGDVASQNQGPDFESSFPKRRKSTLAKRTKSAPGQSKPVPDQHSQEDLSPDLRHTTEHPEEHGSQLTTPPDSSKSHPKKAVPKPRNAKFKPGPFRNPVITKPSVSHEIDLHGNKAITKPVTIHQGWTSTQDAVRSQPGYLSKTTLDKLAAFRYKSYADVQLDRPFGIGGSLQTKKVVGPVEIVGNPGPDSSSDYGFLPGDDSLFREVDADHFSTHPNVSARHQLEQSQQAGWSTDHLHRGDVFFSNVIWDTNTGEPGAHEDRSSQNHFLAPNLTSTFSVAFQPHASLLSAGVAPAPQLMPYQRYHDSHADLNRTHIIHDADDPYPLTGVALAEVMNEKVPTNQSDEICSPRYIRQPAYLSANGRGTVNDKLVDHHQNTSDVLHDQGSLPNHLPEITTNGYLDYSQGGRNMSENSSARKAPSRHVFDVRVERSHSEEPETTTRDIFNDFELDEFDDEGIEDADLLAIISDEAIPGTHPLASGNLIAQPGFELTEVVCLNTICASEPAMPVAANSQLVQDGRTMSPERPSDDEYPLEDGLDEEDMLSLPARPQGVTETFQAPPSLEYSFGNGPLSEEVYDKTLQFSPPKSQSSSVLPSKAVDVSLTDGQSPSRAQLIGNLVSDPAEGEDWSFIRSNDGVKTSDNPVVSDPASDQENASSDKITKLAIHLGPPKQRKRISYPKVYTNTPSSTSEEILLDDSHEYEALQPFARPDFPSLVLDRCPVPGVTAQTFLRVCFRVGEMFREGARCYALKQDAIIELFARVTFSSRESGTTQQHFQFADLWHDRPPFPNGILANYKSSGLAESESRAFIGAEQHVMARCIGRLRKDNRNATGKFIDIISIRPADWEEVKWTKRIVSAGLVRSEKGGH